MDVLIRKTDVRYLLNINDGMRTISIGKEFNL